ncbi:trypsin domain-containing protein [Ditylenchus destructor]|nr:trypsin domain-containing protein [Ditylenchus destructor]
MRFIFVFLYFTATSLSLIDASRSSQKLEDELKCGITYGPIFAERVWNGTEVPLGKWPWVVSIVKTWDDGTGIHHCGASIISDRYLVTVGHGGFDLYNNESIGHTFQVIAGAVNIVENDPPRVNISSYVMHPDFVLNSTTLINDITVIKLATPLNFSKLIQPVCLAGHYQENGTSPEEIAVVAGWGDYTENVSHSITLREGTEHFVDIKACMKKHSRLNEKAHICAEGKYIGTREADSGSPLFVKSQFSDSQGNPRWMQVGINSMANDPDVYTRITTYCDFIHHATEGTVKCVPS